MELATGQFPYKDCRTDFEVSGRSTSLFSFPLISLFVPEGMIDPCGSYEAREVYLGLGASHHVSFGLPSVLLPPYAHQLAGFSAGFRPLYLDPLFLFSSLFRSALRPL